MNDDDIDVEDAIEQLHLALMSLINDGAGQLRAEGIDRKTTGIIMFNALARTIAAAIVDLGDNGEKGYRDIANIMHRQVLRLREDVTSINRSVN